MGERHDFSATGIYNQNQLLLPCHGSASEQRGLKQWALSLPPTGSPTNSMTGSVMIVRWPIMSCRRPIIFFWPSVTKFGVAFMLIQACGSFSRTSTNREQRNSQSLWAC